MYNARIIRKAKPHNAREYMLIGFQKEVETAVVVADYYRMNLSKDKLTLSSIRYGKNATANGMYRESYFKGLYPIIFKGGLAGSGLFE